MIYTRSARAGPQSCLSCRFTSFLLNLPWLTAVRIRCNILPLIEHLSRIERIAACGSRGGLMSIDVTTYPLTAQNTLGKQGFVMARSHVTSLTCSFTDRRERRFSGLSTPRSSG